jgi:hypothetical protein
LVGIRPYFLANIAVEIRKKKKKKTRKESKRSEIGK